MQKQGFFSNYSSATKSGLIVDYVQSAYPTFGSPLIGRTYQAETSVKYRYGFNGKENDDETGTQDYGFRIYSRDLGRFLSVDPLTKNYPWYTPYQFAGNMPIKYIDLDGLEPADNPKDPANQNDRNPTKTINAIYKESGGDGNFKKNFFTFMKGTFDATKTVTGVSNKEGYASDSKNPEEANLWVNNKGVFKQEDFVQLSTKDFANFILGTMINGTGPENIEFPLNGLVSSSIKTSGIVQDAMTSWYNLNKGRTDLVAGKEEFSGNSHMLSAAINKGGFHPESLIGSATITISPINDKEVMVQVFNVTSITSGDIFKDLGFSEPVSVVRNNSNPSPEENKYGNVSQLYQFTLPIDASKLK